MRAGSLSLRLVVCKSEEKYQSFETKSEDDRDQFNVDLATTIRFYLSSIPRNKNRREKKIRRSK